MLSATWRWRVWRKNGKKRMRTGKTKTGKTRKNGNVKKASETQSFFP